MRRPRAFQQALGRFDADVRDRHRVAGVRELERDVADTDSAALPMEPGVRRNGDVVGFHHVMREAVVLALRAREQERPTDPREYVRVKLHVLVILVDRRATPETALNE